MNSPSALTLKRFSRVAGVCYLIIIVLGLLGQVVIRHSLVNPADSAATMANITAHLSLWRWGIVADLMMHVCDIPVIAVLYWVLHRVNQPVALIALVANILQTAVAIANKSNLIYPMLLIGGRGTSLADEHLIQAFLNAHNYGFAIALIFFGIACVLYGYLLAKHALVPKGIAFGLATAGLCYLLNSFVLLLLPSEYAYVMVTLVICLVAEFTFASWLIWRGIQKS